MRVEIQIGKKTWRETSCSQDDEEENKTRKKKMQKVKCLYFMGRHLARQLLGPIQGVQPQIL